MTLIRWNPTRGGRDLATIQDEMNRLFDGIFTSPATFRGDVQTPFAPPVDIEERADEFIVRADLPGVSQKDVKVSLLGDTLTIRGERKAETEKKEGTAHRIERVYGSFERSFTLGSSVRADQVKASYKDGVLEIRVPKAEEARLREIQVQIG
jgi:HSP20 family protein